MRVVRCPTSKLVSHKQTVFDNSRSVCTHAQARTRLCIRTLACACKHGVGEGEKKGERCECVKADIFGAFLCMTENFICVKGTYVQACSCVCTHA